MLYLEALTKIRKNNDFMFLRRYCLFVTLFLPNRQGVLVVGNEKISENLLSDPDKRWGGGYIGKPLYVRIKYKIMLFMPIPKLILRFLRL